MKTFVVIVLFCALVGVGWLVHKHELVTVSVSGGDTYSIEDDVVTFPSGKTVEIYDGIVVAEDVKEIDLSGRGFEGSLQAEIRQLSQLEVLNVSNNNFTGVPAEIGQLTQLRVLNLSNNPITGLPYELGNLSHLEELDLRGTNYATADLSIIQESLPTTTVVLTD